MRRVFKCQVLLNRICRQHSWPSALVSTTEINKIIVLNFKVQHSTRAKPRSEAYAFFKIILVLFTNDAGYCAVDATIFAPQLTYFNGHN